MKALIPVAAAILMTGCAAKVIDSNERMVMVNAGTADPAGAMQLAQAECKKHGRHARLNTKPTEDRQWVFDCVR